MDKYLNKIIYWNGKLARIIGYASEPTITIEMIEKPVCDKCGCPYSEQISIIPTSLLYKENAKPVDTITPT